MGPMKPAGSFKVEEVGRKGSKSDIIKGKLNLLLLALNMDKASHEPKNTGSL